MVYRDYWALSEWYSHYGRAVGHENLYVISHGPDPEIQRICPEASVLVVPRDDLTHFDVRRGQMLNNFQNGLNQYFDWVIRTDADELVCLDPTYYASFHDLFERQEGGSVFALGLDVYDFSDDPPLSEGTPALSQRRNAVFTGHYSKAWAVRNRIALKRHGVKLRSKLVSEYPFNMPKGVYLAHLKYANRAALDDVNHDRVLVANADGLGLPGPAWRDAPKVTRRTLNRAEGLPCHPFEQSADAAWRELQNPVRDEKNGIVRARSVKFGSRTVLPDWFGST